MCNVCTGNVRDPARHRDVRIRESRRVLAIRAMKNLNGELDGAELDGVTPSS